MPSVLRDDGVSTSSSKRPSVTNGNSHVTVDRLLAVVVCDDTATRQTICSSSSQLQWVYELRVKVQKATPTLSAPQETWLMIHCLVLFPPRVICLNG